MRRLFVGVIAALLLLAGLNAAPVSAAPIHGAILSIPAGVTATDMSGRVVKSAATTGAYHLDNGVSFNLTYGTCTERFTYAWYGNAFADLVSQSGSPPCSKWSQVQVTSAINGQFFRSRYCSKLDEAYHNYPDCALIAGGIRAVIAGSLWSGEANVCYVPFGQQDIYPPCSTAITFVVI